MASSAERVTEHRAKLREKGLRPIQLWVADTRRPGFAEECLRQSRALHDDPHEKDVVDWLERAADTTGWRA